MQIDGYVQALREDLARIAAVGDESTARAAELLAGALESALGRRLLEALGEAALELSGQLEEGRVEVRFAGSDPELVLVRDEAEPALEPADEAYTARISLRLPESLKVRLDAAAAPATAGAERSRDVPPASEERCKVGLRRSLGRPRPPGSHRHGGAGEAEARQGRALPLPRPRPGDPEGRLRCPSTVSTRRSRSSSRSSSPPATSTSRRSRATSPSS